MAPSRFGRGVGIGLAALLLVTGIGVEPVASAGSGPPELRKPDSHGITLVSWEAVDGSTRMLDATVTTEAIYENRGDAEIDPLNPEIKVRILLPANYKADRDHRYPVLYLLNGGGGKWDGWSLEGDVANIVDKSSFNGIVVMPEGGWAGWYTDWVGETDGGFAPQWETFHIRQLLPWIDANFNTIKGRKGRSIAGLSMGGLGALAYAGRFRHKFSAVGSLSGGTDISHPGGQAIISDSMQTIGAAVTWYGVGDPAYKVSGDTMTRMRAIFGDEGRSGEWDRKNPIRLAEKKKYNRFDDKLALYSGNTGTDALIGTGNAAFHDVLVDKGVDHRYCTGPGEHFWPWWQQDLADFLEYVYGDTPDTCPNNWGEPVE